MKLMKVCFYATSNSYCDSVVKDAIYRQAEIHLLIALVSRTLSLPAAKTVMPYIVLDVPVRRTYLILF